jgi:hypothetical protein
VQSDYKEVFGSIENMSLEAEELNGVEASELATAE